MRRLSSRTLTLLVVNFVLLVSSEATMFVYGQERTPEVLTEGNVRVIGTRGRRGTVRSVTIPITARGEQGTNPAPLRSGELIVTEGGDRQEVLSLRNTDRSPIALAVLIQDDVVSSVANDLGIIGDFIRNLPEGSRVLVGYIGIGSLRVRQSWTSNLERAAGSLRVPLSTPNASPFNPYVQIIEALRRFEGLPAGRRAMLVISDGLDISRGITSSNPTQSIDLDRAIREAQRRSTAIYSFYAPTIGVTANSRSILVTNAQGSLLRLSDETGGHAFFQGLDAPVSFAPFLRDLNQLLANQYALTYLSANTDKGFQRIDVTTTQPNIKIEHPRGYVR